jgi:Tn3 transposase DDE domain
MYTYFTSTRFYPNSPDKVSESVGGSRFANTRSVTAAIVLWNTVYMERVTESLKNQGIEINPDWYQYLSPLGWEHINLTGDYIWQQSKSIQQGKFRSLRSTQNP